MQTQQIVLQRIADAFLPRQAIEHFARGVALRAIDPPGILAGVLGLIHGGIGARHQLFRIGTVLGIEGDAEAGREPEILLLIAERYLGNGTNDALRELRGLRFIRIRHQHGKLIAAEPGNHFVASHQGTNLARDPDQHGIAGAVAEGVVDVLEFVQIEKQQRPLRLAPLGLGEHASKLHLEAVAVVEAGQRVALGQINKLLGGLAFTRHVLVNPQPADESPVCIMHRVGELREYPAIRQHDLEGFADLVRAQHVQDMLGKVVGPGQDVGRVLHHLLRGPAREVDRLGNQPDAPESRVAVHHPVMAVLEQDADVHGGQQVIQARLLFAGVLDQTCLHFLGLFQRRDLFLQGAFELLALADIPDAGAMADKLAACAIDRLPCGGGPELRAILAAHAEFEVAAGAAARGLLKLGARARHLPRLSSRTENPSSPGTPPACIR